MNSILIGTAIAVIVLLMIVPVWETLAWHGRGFSHRLRKRHVDLHEAIISAERGEGFVILNLGFAGPRGVFYVRTSALSSEEVVKRFEQYGHLEIYGAWTLGACRKILRHLERSETGRVLVIYPSI